MAVIEVDIIEGFYCSSENMLLVASVVAQIFKNVTHQVSSLKKQNFTSNNNNNTTSTPGVHPPEHEGQVWRLPEGVEQSQAWG